MARSASAPIDKPLGAVRKVIKTAQSLLARRAECGNEYEASQNEQKALQEAYDDFQEQRNIMAAVADDLKVRDYKDAEFEFEEFYGATIRRHAVGIRDCYFSWAGPKGRQTFLSQLLMGHEWVLDAFPVLEKALEKARKWLKRRGDKTPAGLPAASLEPLTDSQKAAFDLIKKEGPLLGRQIVNRLGIGSESSFTRHYVPPLKAHGVKNRRGLGYYIDPPT